MARASPVPQVLGQSQAWSFHSLSPWTGWFFPAEFAHGCYLRTGVPHGDALSWHHPGSVNFGHRNLLEVARVSAAAVAALLVRCASWPYCPYHRSCLTLDPRPCCFHARERVMNNSRTKPERRRRGWLAQWSCSRPISAEFPYRFCLLAEGVGSVLPESAKRQAEAYWDLSVSPGCRLGGRLSRRASRGPTPSADRPVLRGWYFPRSTGASVGLIRELAGIDSLPGSFTAHYTAPVHCTAKIS